MNDESQLDKAKTSADSGPAESDADSRFRRIVLLASVFVVGACGLLYELVAGAAASYLMGNTVTQYSLVIGVFLASMGIGAFFTQWIRVRLLDYFLLIQLVIAILGGFSSLVLFATFAFFADITAFVIAITGCCGALAGMEIPLVLRILKQSTSSLRVSVAQVLTLDYIGALAASIAFPLVLIPLLGLVHAALATGAFNAAVGLFGTFAFWNEITNKTVLLAFHVITWCCLLIGWIWAGQAMTLLENRLYPDEIVFAESTAYQRIIVTRRSENNDIRLHLDGHLQFSSIDEYRYHETLVQPALSLCEAPRKILILGGGDGLAIRQVLRFDSVESIELVDIDPRVVEIFRQQEMLSRLNEGCLDHQKVSVIHEDAFSFLRKSKKNYDVIIADLPDPSDVRINKLYSETFYAMALARLNQGGVFVTQATSPYYARDAFWCINRTLNSAAEKIPTQRFQSIPYHVNVPSFGGEWGFAMVVSNPNASLELLFPADNRFLTRESFRTSRRFPPDMSETETKINKLLDPVLVRYHTRGWSYFND